MRGRSCADTNVADKYQCAEWPLFNGLQDAMAFGNHEADYGWTKFEECRASATYPIISAGFVGASTTAM